MNTQVLIAATVAGGCITVMFICLFLQAKNIKDDIERVAERNALKAQDAALQEQSKRWQAEKFPMLDRL